jgi:hypothetical protein
MYAHEYVYACIHMYAHELLKVCTRRITIKFFLYFSFKVPHQILIMQHTGWKKKRENFCVTGSCSNSLVWYLYNQRQFFPVCPCYSLSLFLLLSLPSSLSASLSLTTSCFFPPCLPSSLLSSLFLLFLISNFPLFLALVIYYTILRPPSPCPLPLV